VLTHMDYLQTQALENCLSPLVESIMELLLLQEREVDYPLRESGLASMVCWRLEGIAGMLGGGHRMPPDQVDQLYPGALQGEMEVLLLYLALIRRRRR
jgi:hypothetical protein